MVERESTLTIIPPDAPAAAPAAESSAPQLTDAQKQFFGL